MSGKNNEDRFGVTAFQLGSKNPTPVLVAVLSDGVGGHKAGEVAAELAVNHIMHTVAGSNGQHPTQTMETGIHRASQAIWEESQKDNGKQGMAATVAVTWMVGHRLYTASIGDSRIYLIRGDRIRQISNDHTWIQEALDNHLLTPDQIEGHPNRHVIRRYLGGPTPPEVDFRMRLTQGEEDQQSLSNQGVSLQTGDRLLMSSDGLTDLVSDAEILQAFDVGDASQAVDHLIELANQRGGHDNITIVTFEIPDGIQAIQSKRSLLPAGCLLAIIFTVIAALAVFGFFWLQKNPVNLGFPNKSPTPAPHFTINPIMTSAPQITATEGGLNQPKLVPTLTIEPLQPKQPDHEAYPSPKEAVLTPITPYP